MHRKKLPYITATKLADCFIKNYSNESYSYKEILEYFVEDGLSIEFFNYEIASAYNAFMAYHELRKSEDYLDVRFKYLLIMLLIDLYPKEDTVIIDGRKEVINENVG